MLSEELRKNKKSSNEHEALTEILEERMQRLLFRDRKEELLTTSKQLDKH